MPPHEDCMNNGTPEVLLAEPSVESGRKPIPIGQLWPSRTTQPEHQGER